jgi:hypothetical protein
LSVNIGLPSWPAFDRGDVLGFKFLRQWLWLLASRISATGHVINSKRGSPIFESVRGSHHHLGVHRGAGSVREENRMPRLIRAVEEERHRYQSPSIFRGHSPP